MEKTIKFFRAIVKDVNEDAKTATCIVSTASVDRDGDVILPESFKKRLKIYKDHPILISSHNYFSLTKQIGQAQNVKITEDGLECKFEWFVGKGNPEADWGWFLAQKGIAAFSIGFIPQTWEDGEYDAKVGGYKGGVRRRFTDVELIEVSQVLIPSNRDAVMSERSKIDGMTKEVAEMAIKEFGWDKKDGEPAPVPTPDPDPKEEPKPITPEQVEEIVQNAVKNVVPKLVEEALGPALTKYLKENSPTEDNPEGKTYFDLLLSKGEQMTPDPVLTKEQVAEVFKSVVNQS